jgi:hypothetical protein
MKAATKFGIQAVVFTLIIAAASSSAFAQALTSTPAQTVSLSATLAESLTVSLSGNSVNFNLTAGSPTNAGSTTITATTAWVLKPSRTAVKVYAYFADATAALTDGTTNIPSSAFFIADNGGASTAVNQTIAGFGSANGALQLGATTTITAANRSSNRTDAMAFNLNLSTIPQLPASTYNGTRNIQAQATP